MKATYRVEAATHIPIDIPLMPVNADGVQIEWEADGGQLRAIRFTLTGATPQEDPMTGSIQTVIPELEPQAFRIVSYIANCIFVQTGQDAFDPFAVVGQSALVTPKTLDEKSLFARIARFTVSRSIRVSAHLRARFDPSQYDDNVEHWPALANFADALRVNSPFLRFEQLYKVVEHFADGRDGRKLDRHIGKIMAARAPEFDASAISQLRDLRRRSTHPQPRGESHLNPENIDDIRQIKAELPRLEKLARLLLELPVR